MTNPEPVLWVVRYGIEPLRDDGDSPELSIMRIVDPANSDPNERHEVMTAPPAATGVFIGDPTGAGTAVLTVAQLQPNVDPDRPILLMQPSTVTARPARMWPMHFANIDDADPMAGIALHLHTDEPNICAAWIEGHLFGAGQITVADLIGDDHE